MTVFFLPVLVLHEFNFLCSSLEAEGAVDNSGNLSGNEDVISLSDIIPETNICFVSLNIEILDPIMQIIYDLFKPGSIRCTFLGIYISFIFSVNKRIFEDEAFLDEPRWVEERIKRVKVAHPPRTRRCTSGHPNSPYRDR